jgi:cytidine deaminase
MLLSLFIVIKLFHVDLIIILNLIIILHSVFYEPYKYSIHAEKSAIMNIKNKKILNKCKMVIIKITKGKITTCGPCKMCKELLNKYKITNINTMSNEKIVKI